MTNLVKTAGRGKTEERGEKTVQKIVTPEIRADYLTNPPQSQSPNASSFADVITPNRDDFVSKRHSELMDGWNGSNFAEHWVKSISKPKLDEKALKRQRDVAGITQGLGLLADVIGAKAGAHVRTRAVDDVQKNAEREEKKRNIYQARLDAWEKGLFQAKGMDEQAKITEYMQGLKGLRDFANAKMRADQANQGFAYTKGRDKVKDEQWAETQELRRKQIEEQVKTDAERLAIARQNANTKNTNVSSLIARRDKASEGNDPFTAQLQADMDSTLKGYQSYKIVRYTPTQIKARYSYATPAQQAMAYKRLNQVANNNVTDADVKKHFPDAFKKKKTTPTADPKGKGDSGGGY